MSVHSFHIMQTQREIDEKIAHCDEQAGWYFAQATKGPKAEFDATMKASLGLRGPRYDRARDAAKAKFQEQTKEARELCDRTFDCLMETGEVSSELDAEWTALCELDAVRKAMSVDIHTDEQLPGCWVATDRNSYDGPGSPIGSGATEAEAIDDLLDQLEDE